MPHYFPTPPTSDDEETDSLRASVTPPDSDTDSDDEVDFVFIREIIKITYQNIIIHEGLQGLKELRERDVDKFYPDLAFKYACDNGLLEIAQWLLEVDETTGVDDGKICIYGLSNLNAGQNYFYSACLSGKLHIAQWFYEMAKIDNKLSYINFYFEDPRYLFTLVCERGQVDIINWLETIQSKYYHIMDGSRIIPMIRGSID